MFTSTYLYGKEKDCAGVWNYVTLQRDSAMTALTIIRCFRMDFGNNCEGTNSYVLSSCMAPPGGL